MSGEHELVFMIAELEEAGAHEGAVDEVERAPGFEGVMILIGLRLFFETKV